MMRLLGLYLSCLYALFVAAPASALFFKITYPTAGTQWVNGQTNLITWEKGLQDKVNQFDLELARMSTSGLIYAAKHVPADDLSLNLLIQNVPAGDDYFLLFVNSTHGGAFSTSQRFTILPANGTPTSTPQSPNSAAKTVTVTSGPNPSVEFATTFPALPDLSYAFSLKANPILLTGFVTVGLAYMMGAAWTLL